MILAHSLGLSGLSSEGSLERRLTLGDRVAARVRFESKADAPKESVLGGT